jgi:hypothetical protein
VIYNATFNTFHKKKNRRWHKNRSKLRKQNKKKHPKNFLFANFSVLKNYRIFFIKMRRRRENKSSSYLYIRKMKKKILKNKNFFVSKKFLFKENKMLRNLSNLKFFKIKCIKKNF